MPFTAADMIRLELNLLGIRGARMNDMLTVLKLLGDGRIRTRVAARFPLARVGEAHALLGDIARSGRPHRGAAVGLAYSALYPMHSPVSATMFAISLCRPARNSRMLSMTSGMISSSYSTM